MNPIISGGRKLFVDPCGGAGVVGDELFRFEPERDLVVGGFDRVRAVANVASDLDGKVAADRAGKGSLRVRLAQHHSAHLDHVEPLPHHRANWARVHVIDKAREEGLNANI